MIGSGYEPLLHPGKRGGGRAGSFLKRDEDVVAFELDGAFREVEVEVVVAVLVPQFAALDEVVEVERVEAADVGGVDEVPGAAEDGDAQAQKAAGGEDAMAFAQPGFGHEVEMLENVEAEDFLAAGVGPRPGKLVEVVDDVDVRGMPAAVVVDVAGGGRGAAA